MSRRLTKILIGASVVACLCGVATGVIVWRFVYPRVEKEVQPRLAKWLTEVVASILQRDLESRKLVRPSKAIPGFPSEAVVVFAYLGWQQEGIAVKWPRVGFAIGDGTLILTAAHCVRDLEEKGLQAVSPETFLISPYYGDVSEFKILAVDEKSDLAILKASWSAHPALALASEAELDAAKKILVTGYPQPERPEPPYHFAKEVRMERLPVRKVDERSRNMAIRLEAARFGRPGWSGSALVLPDSGKVVGVLTTLTTQTNYGLLTKRDLSGCSVRSINALLQKHGLTSSAYAPPPRLQPVENASLSFSLAMDYVEAFWNRDIPGSLAIAKQLVHLRPDSVQPHLFLAWSAYAVSAKESKRPDLAELSESSFKTALRLAPDSAHAHAGYGNFLMSRSRYDEALAQLEAASAIEPKDDLVNVNGLRILTKTNPRKAAEMGQALTEKYPANPHYWFWFNGALTALGQHEQALAAARKAVELNPDGLYRGILADALTRSGQLAEAESCYEKMTGDCGCQACWVRYADFLLDHREDKLDEARKAAETAESKEWHRVSETAMKNLRIKLDLAPLRLLAKKSPNEAEALGRRLLQGSPTNGHYWFELAGVLRTLGKHAEAVGAAQRAVHLCPDSSYQPRLANTLAKAGRLDESERTYKEMLREHSDRPRYWFWYAEFLQDYHPQRIEDARAALAKAQSPSPNWSVPAKELESLRVKLESEKAGTKPPESGAR